MGFLHSERATTVIIGVLGLSALVLVAVLTFIRFDEQEQVSQKNTYQDDTSSLPSLQIEPRRGRSSTSDRRVPEGAKVYPDQPNFVHTDTAVYFRYSGERIDGADPDTFRVLPEVPYSYAYDQESVFYLPDNELIPGIDPQTFAYVGRCDVRSASYVRDDQHIITRGAVLSAADASSFQYLGYLTEKDGPPLGMGYAKDADSVFVDCDEELEGADAATFTRVGGKYFADKNNIYYWSSAIAHDTDPDTFQYLGFDYAKDRHNVYFSGMLVAGADPESFEYLGSAYAKDAMHAYYYGERIEEDVDVATFTAVARSYAKDARQVYYDGIVEPGVAPDECTAEHLEGCSGL